MTLEGLRSLFFQERIPVWGIANASQLADEPEGRRPEDLVPGARSLVCFGAPVPRGAYRMPEHAPETVWRSQNLMYRRLDTLSERIAALLESSGAQAVPVYGCIPLDMNDRGEVTGYLNQIRMGEAAGIGVRGRNGLLLHSRYGSRLMLGGAVTTAILPEVRCAPGKEPGCAPDCRICVDACPVQAVAPGEKRVHIMRCLFHTSRVPLLPKTRFLLLRAFRPRSAARLVNLTTVDEHTFHVCSRCVGLCPYGEAPQPGPEEKGAGWHNDAGDHPVRRQPAVFGRRKTSARSRGAVFHRMDPVFILQGLFGPHTKPAAAGDGIRTANTVLHGIITSSFHRIRERMETVPILSRMMHMLSGRDQTPPVRKVELPGSAYPTVLEIHNRRY